jgi:uncharacterized protein (TIGR03437 family)
MPKVEGFRLRSGAAYASLLLILICHGGRAQEDHSRSGSGVVASAADRRNPDLTPGGLAALFCNEMTGDSAKTTVEVNGIRATVLYASETQINFVVPEQVRSGTGRVVATSSSGRQSIAVAPLREVSPSLFTRTANGIGEVSALDAIRRTSGPFPTGPDTLVTILGTGIRNAKEVAVTIGGRAATVTSFGPEGRSAGLDQVTIKIPPGIAAQGALPLELTADGRTTGNGVTLTLIAPR